MIRKLSFSIVFILYFMSFETNTLGQGFKINGRKLLDANGNEFIIRGVNNAHIWFNYRAYHALDRLANRNVNTIRIIWMTEGKPKELDKIIGRCIELNMIPMIELHDATGNPTSEKLLETATYYTQPEVLAIIKKYEKYILVNFANEWGDHTVTSEYWRDSYFKAIDLLRKAGIKTTLVIDAPGWGQNLQPILEFGKDVLEYDQEKNILFSVHMYGSWNDSNKIDQELQKAYDLSLPLIVGEFGYNYNDGGNNLKCKADHTAILRKCQELSYGYMPWSWAGNNKENRWLDLSYNWRKLSWWGKEVFEGENGIQKTSKPASIFGK